VNEDYKTNLEGVRSMLREFGKHDKLRHGYAYRSGYNFLAQHGIEYKPTLWPGGYKQGAPRMCYGNAIVGGAVYGLRYVEGITLSPHGIATPHAWNLSAEGELLDLTWLNTGLVYIGVEFSLERADDATWNGDACVLDDWKRRWPLFRKPWAGENYNLTWPASDRLAALRSPNKYMPDSVLEWEARR
jgi:hypothetical protein